MTARTFLAGGSGSVAGAAGVARIVGAESNRLGHGTLVGARRVRRGPERDCGGSGAHRMILSIK